MEYAKKSFLLLFALCTGLLSVCWRMVSFAFSALDFEPDVEEKSDTNVWYNYRTGEIDPVKRYDGIYQERLQK
ncbi:hypothetical protein [Porticoccus sp.]|uniref:hypothetical protein n=1 Tax=Porticoccus sp. TaxID=2024853 RepID=UPI000C5433F3|nr:hypothetical protein [Porticoccus sp.]MAZ69130.1 hypothetical protein [Porticoccus sp.]